MACWRSPRRVPCWSPVNSDSTMRSKIIQDSQSGHTPKKPTRAAKTRATRARRICPSPTAWEGGPSTEWIPGSTRKTSSECTLRLFARRSCRLTARMKECIGQQDYTDDPKRLLIECVHQNKQTGSSTFIIGSISENSRKLNLAFLGDSGGRTMSVTCRRDRLAAQNAPRSRRK